MSRESFIRSEDREFEVTFREVRNWDEYADLDFETDTAPLTDEETGTAENVNEDNLWDDSDYVVTESSTENTEEETPEVEDEAPEENVEGEPEDALEDNAESANDSAEETEAPEEDAENEEVDPTEEDAENSDHEVTEPAETVDEEPETAEGEDSFTDEESADHESAARRGTSAENTVALPVVDEDFDMGPAWEEEPEEAEGDTDEEIQLGEPAGDTEAFGASLEHLYEAEDKEVPATDAYSSTETLNLAQLVAANNEDKDSIDTFEAITGEGESLNKADVVEEVAPEYSDEAQPVTIPVEPGEYLSLDGISLDNEEDEAPEEDGEVHEHSEKHEVSESEDEDDLSLELDYSEED